MSKLYVEDSGQRVGIAELAVVAGKQQVILGASERDLVLRTAGNVKIQVGNKFYDLPLSDSTDAVVNSSVTTILDNVIDLDTLLYPGDGQFVYIKENQSFYVTVDNQYVKIISNEGETVTDLYLSYSTTQDLTGLQKQTVSLNTGMFINSFTDLSAYTADSTYVNQLVYNITERKHYVLTDPTNPSAESSWSELYLSIEGGVLNGRLTIGGGDRADSLLHINGQYTGLNADSLQVGDAVLTIGEKDKTAGIAIWSNLNTYIQNYARNSRKGIKFLTKDEVGNNFTPLTLYSQFVGLFSEPDYNYNLTIEGSSKQTGLGTLNKGIQSDTYSQGSQGYTLTQDANDDKWLLEVDKLTVRDAMANASKFDSKSIDGSYWANPSLKVKSTALINTINVYTLASKAGNYKDVGGTMTVIPLSEKSFYVMADTPTDPLDESSAREVQRIKLEWGLSDQNISGVTLPYDTYVKRTNNTYEILTGEYDLVGGEFVESVGGQYLLTQSVNVIFIQTDSVNIAPIGTLLYYASWNPDTSENDLFLAKVIDQADDGVTVEVYRGENLTIGQELVIVGNTIDGGDGMHWNGIDGGDYLEHLNNVTSFRQLFDNIYYNDETTEALPINTYKPSTTVTTTKVGDLSNLQDAQLEVSGKGLYSSNAFLKGKFVINKGIHNNIPTTTTYYPFLMLNGSNMMEKVDLSTKIAQWDSVAAGTPNFYIKNQTSQQSTSNFNISGTGIASVFNTPQVQTTSGGITDGMGPINATLPTDGNIYAFLGLTRLGSFAMGLGMDTTNNFVIGTGTNRDAGAVLDIHHFSVNPLTGDTTVDGYVLAGQFRRPGGTGQVLLDDGTTAPYSGSGIGSVTVVNSTTGDITITNNTTTPALTLAKVNGTTISYYDPTSSIQTQLNGKQAALSGTGFVKISGTTISYDNSTYLTTSTAASTYHPLENQRLSTTNNVAFKSETLTDYLSTPTIYNGTTSTNTLTLKNHSGAATGFVIDANGLTGGGGASVGNHLFVARGNYNISGNTSVRDFFSNSQVVGTTSAITGGFLNQFTTTIGATNNQDWTGINGLVGVRGAVNISTGSTGNLSNAIAIQATAGFFGMTTGNYYGVQVIAVTGTATINNLAALSVNSQTRATNNTYLLTGTLTIPTGNWGIYHSSAYNHYLGTGATLINTTTDDGINKLQVNGGGSFTGNLSAVLPAYSSGTILNAVYNSTNNRFETASGTKTMVSVTTTATLGAAPFDQIVSATAATVGYTITLPTAVGVSGQTYTIKKVDSTGNVVTVGTSSSQTIDGNTTYALAAQWKYLTVVSNGSNWIIIANN